MSETTTTIPPYKNSDAAPFVCFDVVAAFGVMNGAIQIELADRILTPGSGTDVTMEFVATGRLRCSPTAAALLRDAIDKSLEMLNQPQQQTVATGKLN